MTELSSLFPDLVDLVHIGRSAEQRDMFALEISKEKPELSRRDLKRKKAIVIMGSQHAREVCTPFTLICATLNQFLVDFCVNCALPRTWTRRQLFRVLFTCTTA